MNGDLRGNDKYRRKLAAQRIGRAGGMPSARADYARIARPSGVAWEKRCDAAYRQKRTCAYCGEFVQRPARIIDHVYPLSYCTGLTWPTSSLDNPGNKLGNLRTSCQECNSAKSNYPPEIALQKISEARGIPVADLTMPDVTDVVRAIEAARGIAAAVVSPPVWPRRLSTYSGYTSVADALEDLAVDDKGRLPREDHDGLLEVWRDGLLPCCDSPVECWDHVMEFTDSSGRIRHPYLCP